MSGEASKSEKFKNLSLITGDHGTGLESFGECLEHTSSCWANEEGRTSDHAVSIMSMF